MKTLLPLATFGLLALAGPALAQTPAPATTAPTALRFAAPPNATPAQLQEAERQRWNFYLTDSTWRATRFNAQPNALLVETVRAMPPGTALDMGAGEGRNALYLAKLGWQVTAVDVADKALAFAQQKAQAAGTHLTTVVTDADSYDWGLSKWNLIVLSYAGGRTYAVRAFRSLRPGGLVVLEGFHRDAAKILKLGDDLVYDTDELKRLYAAAGFRIVRYEEPVGTADFSKQQLKLVKLVAQKP